MANSNERVKYYRIGEFAAIMMLKGIIHPDMQENNLGIRNGVVVDYAMNTLCAAGTGAFLSSQAKRLGVQIEDLGDIALKSKKYRHLLNWINSSLPLL